MRSLLTAALLLSLSLSSANAEASRFHGVTLPPSGQGYIVPATWATRGLSWGTPALVGLLQRSAKRVLGWDRAATVYIGDLSRKDGAATRWHRSHRRGVDADVLLFAARRDGTQLPPPKAMKPFARSDASLDVSRNWLLLKALIVDAVTEVRVVFLADWIKRRVLERARARGEDPRLVARASRLVAQPSDSAAHDDHMHVRIVAAKR